MILNILFGGFGFLGDFLEGTSLEGQDKDESRHRRKVGQLRPKVFIHFSPDDIVGDVIGRGLLALQPVKYFSLDALPALVVQEKRMGCSP